MTQINSVASEGNNNKPNDKKKKMFPLRTRLATGPQAQSSSWKYFSKAEAGSDR